MKSTIIVLKWLEIGLGKRLDILYSKIGGTGSYLPAQILTNHDLEKKLDTSHAWIVERTGIERRHIANENETTEIMGAKAAKMAMEAANIEPNEIGLIIVASCTPEKMFPSTACLIQEILDIPKAPAFDIQAACSGFIYALSVADNFIRMGQVKHALVIGSETMSKVLDWKDRKTCVLFGDGAGAVLLSRSETPGILSTEISADGRHKDILYLDNQKGNQKERDTAFNPYLQMQGNLVFRLAVNMLDQVAVTAMVKNKLECSDVDWLVPHQANIRIIQAMAEKLKIPMERVAMTLKDHGNTSAASIPLTLDTYIRQGSIKRNQILLLEAFGGGLTWGTATIRY